MYIKSRCCILRTSRRQRRDGYLRPAGPQALQSFPRQFRNSHEPAKFVPGGPAASPACRDPRHYSRRNIRTCGRRGRRPSNRSRDNSAIRMNPRNLYLEGRRPRRLAATLQLNSTVHLYLGSAGQPRLQRTQPLELPTPSYFLVSSRARMRYSRRVVSC